MLFRSIAPRLIISAPPKISFTNAALSPNGKYVVAVGGDSIRERAAGNGVMRVYNAHSGALLFARVVSDYWLITGLAISSDSSEVATSSQGETMVWDLAKGKLLRKLGFSADAIAFSPDNRVLVAGDASTNGSMATLRNAQNGAFIGYVDKGRPGLEPNEENFMHVFPRCSPDGKSLACITFGGKRHARDDFRPTKNTDGRVQIWNIATGKLRHIFPQKNTAALAFSPNGKNLAISSVPGKTRSHPQIRLYDFQIQQLVWIAQVSGETSKKAVALQIVDMTFSPDNKVLACQDEWNRILLYNADSGQIIRTVLPPNFDSNSHSLNGTLITSKSPSLSFSQDGKTVLSGQGDTIYLWNTDDWNIQ